VHIALVAHGNEEIPSKGWGAVEHVIWQYACELRTRGIEVSIVNEKKWKAIRKLYTIQRQSPIDIIHCHAEKPIRFLSQFWKTGLVVSTTHNPMNQTGLTSSELKALKRCQSAPYHLTLREDISQLIQSRNPNAVCSVQPNGIVCNDFQTTSTGNGKAIYVGRIQERKRQNPVAEVLFKNGIACDFYGPDYKEIEMSEVLRSMYRGEIHRAELMSKLCEYSCLILASESEGQPLVVVEALAAGIPVVVSNAAAANLDLSRPFIHRIKSDDDIVESVKLAISQRDLMTDKIREYAEENFDFSALADRYIAQLLVWIDQRK
jgi:glycosyltransferase involved in cell wall biosynthesis